MHHYGEIWQAIFKTDIVGREQGHSPRPVLIVSSDLLNEIQECGVVLAAPITSTDRNVPWHPQVTPENCGLDDPGVVMLDQIRATDKSRLKKRMGQANGELMSRVREELMSLLDLDEDLGDL